MERCPSGLRCGSRKSVWGNPTVGSNPTLSAIKDKVILCLLFLRGVLRTLLFIFYLVVSEV